MDVVSGEDASLLQSATQGLLVAALRLYLDLRSRPRPLLRHLAKKPATPADWSAVDPRAVPVAAVQMELALVKSARQYADMCYEACRQAAATGALLVAFPEDVATHLLGLLPGIERMAGAAGLGAGAAAAAGAAGATGPSIKVADVFRLMGPAMRRIYTTTFSYLARAFRVYIAAGSAVLPATGDGKPRRGAPPPPVYNEAHLFDPRGQIVGRQRKLHLLPMEEEWGVEPGAELSTFGTPIGRVAMPVCMDSTFFETFRIADTLWSDIVVIPAANPEEYNFWKALRGIWPRVQESTVYGISSCMVGEVLGLKLTGRSGIFAPLEISPRGDGVLAQLDDPHRPGVVAARVNLVALRELRERRRASRPGRAMWRQLSTAYGEYRARCGKSRTRL